MTMQSLARVLALGSLLAGFGCGSNEDPAGVQVIAAAGSGADDNAGGSPSGAGSSSYGGGADAGTDIEIDLDTEAVLSDLATAQAVALCNATADATEAAFSDAMALRLSCFVSATTFSTKADGSVDVAQCKDAFDTCLGEADLTSSSSERSCDGPDVTEQFRDCGATVGQFEDCIEQALSGLNMLLDILTCDNAAAQSLDPATMAQLAESPASCQSVTMLCPNLELGGSSDSTLSPSPTGCDNTCPFASDGDCDDGGPDSDFSACGLGTDCDDCGAR